jgi:putative ubiquitin-RnfH superfamily antitoxin RatB of RatAB toxin-antitoxin module
MDLDIPLRTSLNKWIQLDEIGGQAQIKVDYLTLQQQKEIDEITLQITYYVADAPKIVKFSELNKEETEIDFAKCEPAIKVKIISLLNERMTLTIKYSIKDWKGFNSGGKEIACKLNRTKSGTELDNSLFERLISYMQNTLVPDLGKSLLEFVYDKIQSELRWNETDKKKSN